MTLANYPGPWVEQAACASVGAEIFYVGTGESTRPAKRICARCDVRAECLEYALDNIEEHGVWAGYTRDALQRIRMDDDERASIFAELRGAA